MSFHARETNERRWKGRIQDFLQSGLTRPDYCRKHDLNQQQFLSWLGRHYESSSNLIPVRVSNMEQHKPRSASLFDVEFSNGCKIQIHDLSTLSAEFNDLVRLLNSSTGKSNATTL